MKHLILSILFLLCHQLLFAQVVINEGSNRNYTLFPDENGDYPDWIELYNSSSDTISLLNYSLSDDAATPQKWTFPAINILPNEHKTVFCSGKDRKPISGFTHVLTASNYTPTVGWNTHTFTTPFYWDGVSNILVNTCSYSSTGYTLNSIFNQSATSFASTLFAFVDNSDASCGFATGNTANQRPNMQFDGATVGNGTIQNSGTDYPAPYGNWYWSARHQILILASELSAAGLSAGYINSLAFDVAATDPNMVYDYVEFDMMLVSYNSLSTSFEMVNPNMFQHTNFSLSRTGENVGLYSPSQQLVSSLFINCQNLNESRGSLPDASSNVVRFGTGTPDSTNNFSQGFNGYVLAPVLSQPSGIYASMLDITITNPNGVGSAVYYTTDGSEPTTASTLYTGNPIPVFYSQVIRARAFGPGFLPSGVVSASYLLGIDHETPIISVITDNSNLYGPEGIFDNWQFDWQRTAHMDYFTADEQFLFSRKTAMQIDGGWGGSRSHPQHSFRLEMDNGTLGSGPANYSVIPNRPNRTKYSSFYLRNGSNQWLQFPFKDGFQQEAMSGTTNNYYAAWRPVTVYINGSYFGLYELREKLDEEFFQQNDGADNDSLDILSLSAWNNFTLRSVAGAGSPVDTFTTMYTAFNALNPNSPTYWDDADQYFDQTYYVDYIIAESWMGNTDWPGNNIKIYRSNKTDFRYRFVTIDMELAMAPYSWSDCFDDHIAFMLGQSTGNPFINIWLKGIQNNRFKDYFVNRFADVMNTEYLPSRLIPLENNFFNQMVVEMQNEYERWGDPNNIPGQMTDFYNSHLTFQYQLTERSNQVRDHIENNFNLPNQVDLVLDVHPAGAGRIHISTIEPTEYPWNGIYFNGVPIKIEALPNNGYNFSHWGSNGLITDQLNAVFLDTLDVSSIQFDAYFQAWGVGMEEYEAFNGFSLYPNPAQNEVTIVNTSDLKEANLYYQFVDVFGRVIEKKALTGSVETTADIRHLANGLWLVQIVSGDRVMQQMRLIKVGE